MEKQLRYHEIIFFCCINYEFMEEFSTARLSSNRLIIQKRQAI